MTKFLTMSTFRLISIPPEYPDVKQKHYFECFLLKKDSVP